MRPVFRLLLLGSVLLSTPAWAAGEPDLTLTRVKPDVGSTTGGARIELKGTGFDVAMKVTVGGQACAKLWVPATANGKRAQCTVVAGSAGKTDVVVSHGGKSATKTGGFEFYEPGALERALPKWVRDFAPITILLVVVALVLGRLPRTRLPVDHSKAFIRRRVMNWLPLGLTYAFLYMGRYNMTVSYNALGDLMAKADFGTISTVGSIVYGCSFLINGPLTDKYGGRLTILISSAGSALMNLLLGVVTWAILTDRMAADNLVLVFSVIYGLNMYFQSFGAVSIVKVNAQWFHLRERGVFGAIFGILISLGIYFAFDIGKMIVGVAEGAASGASAAAVWWVFWAPAVMLAIFHVIDRFLVFDTPSDTGHADFDAGDASSGDDGERLPVFEVARRMFTNPAIVTIALIEFCSGFLRNAIMQWYRAFAKETGIYHTFVPQNWGMLLCCAGILGGVFAGVISDRVFQSRRGPVAAILYAGMVCGGIGLTFILAGPSVGWLVIFMSLCVIGVHGMLSGTASMDFGGKKNVGVAVGLIDGMVYLGTAAQFFYYGNVLPKKGAGAEDPNNWMQWPVAMVVMALIGLALATRVWNAKPKGREPAATDRAEAAT